MLACIIKRIYWSVLEMTSVGYAPCVVPFCRVRSEASCPMDSTGQRILEGQVEADQSQRIANR